MLLPFRKALLSRRFTAVCWILTFAAVAGVIQYSIPYPVDGDTAYHFAVGKLIRKYGILHSFPWTPFSWLSEHYADKEFLFHLLFVPLDRFDLITASRIVGTVAGATALSTLYFILRSESVEFPGLWALLPLTSTVFLCRLALVRPHVFSIALALTLIWAASRRRLVPVFIVALIYPLSYVAFWQMTLLLIVAVEGGRLLSGERAEWKPAAAALCGILLGVALHPNSMNLLRINWIHMSDVFLGSTWKGKAGFDMGMEILPYSPRQWVQFLTPAVLTAGAALILSWKNRKEDALALAFSLAALGFGVLTVGSARFLEYFVPLAVAALAVAARPVKMRFFTPAVFGVSLLYVIVVASGPIFLLVSGEEKVPAADAQIFRQVIPVEAQVFNTEWDLTGALMLALPERRFIVALDPTLFYLQDPELYAIWYRLPREGSEGAAEMIRQRFGSRYVLSTNRSDYGAFYDRLSGDPTVRTLMVSDKWVLFDLGEPERR
jgi:hypothetical protein